MSDILLPVRADLPKYQFKTTLEGTLYTFRFRWNARFERWIMDILTSDESDILLGIPININANVIGRFKDARLPPGQLLPINIESEHEEPTRDNFGDNVLMFYRESE